MLQVPSATHRSAPSPHHSPTLALSHQSPSLTRVKPRGREKSSPKIWKMTLASLALSLCVVVAAPALHRRSPPMPPHQPHTPACCH